MVSVGIICCLGRSNSVFLFLFHWYFEGKSGGDLLIITSALNMQSSNFKKGNLYSFELFDLSIMSYLILKSDTI